MGIDQATLEELAHRLDEAARTATKVPMISLGTDGLTPEDGYAIQRASIALRLSRGERQVGMKMGLTSRAKMEQVGVHQPIYGHLTDEMVVDDGGLIVFDNHCHPRVEPEICFRLARPLAGAVSAEEALAACDGVCAALEVIDSRYKDFKFTLSDVVADNASSSKFALGPWCDPSLDAGGLTMEMRAGDEVRVGSSDAILDHPLNSLVAMAAQVPLKAGWVVMCGASTAAVHLCRGMEVSLSVDGMSPVGFRVQ